MTADRTHESLPPGTILGRYRLERRIAEGGMAQVYEATHLDLLKRVALKLLLPRYATDATLVQRFVLEARAASRLQHPHVLGVSDFGLEGERPYMVLDLLEGEDLADLLVKGGALRLPRLIDLVLPIVSAMGAAHAEGILHRNLKPENVFVTKRQGREYPVLLDFGVSMVTSSRPGQRALTREGESVGTPFYMSPEHVNGARDLDGRTDQYAIGVLLYQCATGALPYQAPTLLRLLAKIVEGGAPPPSHVDASVPPELDAIVMRAMAVSRDNRYPTMRHLGRALWPHASAVAQAIWAEEFGDPQVVAERISGPPVVVRPEDLGAFEAFEALPVAAVEGFLRRTRGRRLPAGATVVQQGARAHGCFLLVSGKVDVVKTTPNGNWVLGRLTPGSIFGQIALINHVPRTASVVAAEEIVLVEVDREAFEHLLAETDDVAQALREQVARSAIRQLRRATRRLASLLQRGAPGRSRDPRQELVYLQAAAREWSLPIEDED